jgi:general stress protein YciG
MILDTSKRGFASMDEEKRKRIASMGGKASGGNFARNPQRASEAGRKGGQRSHAKKNEESTRQNSPAPHNTSDQQVPFENTNP